MTSVSDSENFKLNIYDLAERLLGNKCDINELAIWPPNLFALSGYVFSVTGAYQTVISPPDEKPWPPSDDEITSWLTEDNLIESWIKECGLDIDNFKKSLFISHHNYINKLKKDRSLFLDYESEAYKTRIKNKIFDETERKHFIGNLGKGWQTHMRVWGRQWVGDNALNTLRKSDINFILNKAKDHRKSSIQEQERLVKLMLSTVPSPILLCWAKMYSLLKKEKLPLKYLHCARSFKEDFEPSEKAKYELGWTATKLLLTLHAIADEACCGWGIRWSGDKTLGLKKQNDLLPENITEAQIQAENILKRYGTLATIISERGRVLPKRHTPKVGITLRNLSNNLAFQRSSVRVLWRESANNIFKKKFSGQVKSLNNFERISVLLLPWPLDLATKSFQPNEVDGFNEPNKSFFYNPDPDINFENRLRKTIDEAEKELVSFNNAKKVHPKLDLVILPESACGKYEITILEKVLSEKKISMYITGVHEDRKEGEMFGGNAVYSKTLNISKDSKRSSFDLTVNEKELYKKVADPHKQYKHHRWCLEKGQIRQYSLGRVLSENFRWWEGIKMKPRQVTFHCIGDRLTICPLICEDLARQDPIADIIRQVGPSLVVTILMDGPQLMTRWSSKYAGVFSDDPGSAVLTLTSFGMVKRWDTPYTNLSRVVSLWSDGFGPPREIELARGAVGVMLTLDTKLDYESTADGRIEDYATSSLGLVDITQIFVDETGLISKL